MESDKEIMERIEKETIWELYETFSMEDLIIDLEEMRLEFRNLINHREIARQILKEKIEDFKGHSC